MSTLRNMTSGSPARLMISFALPLMLGNLFQQFYTIADAAIVGQVLGVQAIAAVGAAEWVIWMIQASHRDLPYRCHKILEPDSAKGCAMSL